jgi:hypothetical protein
MNSEQYHEAFQELLEKTLISALRSRSHGPDGVIAFEAALDFANLASQFMVKEVEFSIRADGMEVRAYMADKDGESLGEIKSVDVWSSIEQRLSDYVNFEDVEEAIETARYYREGLSSLIQKLDDWIERTPAA